MSLSFIKPDWPVPPRVRTAFTLRQGGVSHAPYDSLNLGTHVGDDLAAVMENRRRVREALGLPLEPTWLRQVHGTKIVTIDGLDSAATPEADGVVSRSVGRVCVIQVADCLPVLFAARDGSVVGAAHAGWRGLAAGVLEAMVSALGIPSETLMAWLGPSIGPASFEVGEEVRSVFTSHDADARIAFRANDRGRWQCDLYALARQRLGALGMASICGGGWDTCADSLRFYSFRRSGQCGRMAALVWLE